jgi:hypothetical protein
MNIIPLSRVDIYEFWCDPSLIDEVNEELFNTPIEWKQAVSEHNDNQSTGYLHRETAVSYYHYRLFDWFQECLNKVSNLHYNKNTLTIADSWLTKSEFGQGIGYHPHASSVVSGLLYLSTFSNSGTIFKYDDPWSDHLPNLLPPGVKSRTLTINSEKGKLILWRSDIDHMAEPHLHEPIRHTLAFNTFFDGPLNHNQSFRLNLKVESVKEKYEAYINKKNNEAMQNNSQG